MAAVSGVERLRAFIVEREATRWRKENNLPMDNRDGKPLWTEDPILAEYRFCNVRREDDRVTRWIATRWRDRNPEEPDLWFAMVVARFINWPDTLNHTGFPVPWDPKRFLEVMHYLKGTGKKMYTGAYMVRADREHKNKFEYQEKVVFTPMWNAREQLRPKKGDTLNSYHMLLGQFHGLGSFMAAQIVADLKYVSPLSGASDWHTFAASGPGSRRGLNRVHEQPVDRPWTEEKWRASIGRLQNHSLLSDLHFGNNNEPLHAQDLQNCLCEFDKYERVRLGEGRPRARFVSHGDAK